MRYAARVDSTQAEIVETFRRAGASVWIIGLPVDLLIGVGGSTALVECKSLTGKRAPRPKDYTGLQKKFMLDWKGGPVATITDAEGAMALVRMLATSGEGS